jgi:hypothetical protein
MSGSIYHTTSLLHHKKPISRCLCYYGVGGAERLRTLEDASTTTYSQRRQFGAILVIHTSANSKRQRSELRISPTKHSKPVSECSSNSSVAPARSFCRISAWQETERPTAPKTRQPYASAGGRHTRHFRECPARGCRIRRHGCLSNPSAQPFHSRPPNRPAAAPPSLQL